LKFIFYVLITSAFCSNIFVVAQTTILSVLGASLALRGPDGSMMTATDGLYHERVSVFKAFGRGLVFTMGSVVLAVWLHLHWEASVICCSIAVFTMSKMREAYYRIVKKFDFDESMTVDFRDIFDGPAAIHAVPRSMWRLGMATVGGNGLNSKDSFDPNDRRRGSSHVKDEEDDSLIRRQRLKSNHTLEMV
jgi:type IV secretory pathway VirB6-like protein